MGHHRWLHNHFPPFFSVLHCPLGLGKLKACSFPGVVFPPLFLSALSSSSLCLVRWFWPNLMNGRHVHITSVCISSQWSGLHVVRSWHGLHCLWHGHCMRCIISCGSTSFPRLIFFFGALLSMINKHTGRWTWQGSTSVVFWNCEKCSCHSKLVSYFYMVWYFFHASLKEKGRKEDSIYAIQTSIQFVW